jgi:threonine/homoserine/homoserine lactone efflux protein
MPYDTLIALCIYALVTSVSPGPSNFMLLASGVNFGFARTIPQVLGITAGFTSLLLGMGLGLGAVLAAFPALHMVLRVAGGAYLLWLAWRIGTSRSLSANADSEARPLRFVDSALFQWVNPKAWVVAMTAMSVYIDDNAPLRSVLLICLVFALVNLPGVAVWAAFGVSLRRFLSDPARLKYFNICMGLLLATTLWPMLM